MTNGRGWRRRRGPRFWAYRPAAVLAVERYHIRKEQLIEAALYLFVIAAAVIAPVLRQFTTRGRRTNVRRLYPGPKDEANRIRWNQNACCSATTGRNALALAG